MPELINLRNIPVTLIIMLMMLCGSLAGFINKDLYLDWLLHPAGVVKRKEYYRLFTSDFVHNDLMHLFLNEAMAYFVCGSLETFLNSKAGNGSLVLMVIYLAGHFAGVGFVTLRNRNNYGYSSAGASGSILGCMMSFMILRPDFTAFYLPYAGGVKNLYAGLIVIAGLLVYQWKSGNRLMDHELHLYSAIGGIAATLAIFPGLI